jgi:hypothetical protein
MLRILDLKIVVRVRVKFLIQLDKDGFLSGSIFTSCHACYKQSCTYTPKRPSMDMKSYALYEARYQKRQDWLCRRGIVRYCGYNEVY